ncbi:MAG TPA: hypothetical protein VF342_00685 [Alphaproteobacteria bacterium]
MDAVRLSTGVAAIFLALVTGCGPGAIAPTYDYRGAYGGIAAPDFIEREFENYARLVCGDGDYRVLDRHFVGMDGPQYVWIRFGCT